VKNIQTVLNAILSKNIFEYIMIDRDLNVLESSSGVEKFLTTIPATGSSILDFLPELVGCEDDVKKIFAKKYCLYSLESVYKNDYYVNISVEYCDDQTAIVLLHNITAVTLSRQKILQYSNESTLLYNTLKKVIDSQNALIFISHGQKIEFANKKFMCHFKADDMNDIRKKDLQLYKLFDKSLNSYDDLFERVSNKEEHIKIDNDTFILKATLIEATHKLFTMTEVTNLFNEVYIDPLTGIYRKDHISKVVTQMLTAKEHFALTVLDLDNFKKINDTFGHLIGDQVLQDIVELIKNHIRKDDLFARWGGEEFILILKSDSPKDALSKIEFIRKTINKHCFDTIGTLTSSFGVAYTKDDDTIESLLHRADKALYEAKIEGKNQVVFKE